MSPTFKIPDIDFTFNRVLRLSHVEGFFNTRPKLNDPKDIYPKVWFADYDEELGSKTCGVAIVVQEGKKLLYCSAFTNRSFSGTWLYTTFGYLFKLCNYLAMVMKEKRPVEIYLTVCENSEIAQRTAKDIKDIIDRGNPPMK